MENLLAIILPLATQYGPGIVTDIIGAFKKAGYTVAQVDAIFAQVVPYNALGINPNAPVQPETPPSATTNTPTTGTPPGPTATT